MSYIIVSVVRIVSLSFGRTQSDRDDPYDRNDMETGLRIYSAQLNWDDRVVSVVRIVCDHLGSVSINMSRPVAANFAGSDRDDYERDDYN